ncbi:MFS transporter [Micromonospora sp. DT53]|uniref:MFS transporter n=1 Tax=Micromonospora sp. DT53 TaxID=3393444 RepID=UPI003CFBBED2
MTATERESADSPGGSDASHRRPLVLENAPFRRLLTAQSLSLVGDQIATIALTFLILRQGSDGAFKLSMILAAKVVALSVSSIFAGVLADRWSRRKVMMLADAVSIVAQGATALLVLTGQIDIIAICVLQALCGLAVGSFRPSSVGIVPVIVPQDRLLRANSLISASGNAANVLGPVVGGAVLGAFGTTAALIIDVATFVVSLTLIARLPDVQTPLRVAERARDSLRNGWTEVIRRPWLRWMLIYFSCFQFAVLSTQMVAGPIRMQESFHGATSWSYVVAALGIGTVLGSMLAPQLRPRRPLVVTLVSVLSFCLSHALLAVAGSIVVIAAGFAIAGVGLGIASVLWATTLQTQVPNDMLSRVSSYDWLTSTALRPVGLAITGLVVARWEPRAPLLIAVALLLVVTGAVLLSSSVRDVGRAREVPALDHA